MKEVQDLPPCKKLREVTAADFAVIEVRLSGMPGPDYSQIRDTVAAELGLTVHQVGAVRMHILNGNQPSRNNLARMQTGVVPRQAPFEYLPGTRDEKVLCCRPLHDLRMLTTTARNRLERLGIRCIDDLICLSEDDLAAKGFSAYSIDGISNALKFAGLSLRT